MKTLAAMLTVYTYSIYLILLISSSLYLALTTYRLYLGYILLPHEHMLFTISSCYILLCLAFDASTKLYILIYSVITYLNL